MARHAGTRRSREAIVQKEQARVLVVDDVRDNADMLALLCEIQGFEVSVAYSGAEAVERARTFRPQVALCDIGLPDISGYALAKVLRSDSALGNVALIAVSGYGRPEDKDTAIAAGFDGHLTKPIEFGELLAMINRLVESEQGGRGESVSSESGNAS